MPERVETAIVGAGQAGLATSYFLTARDVDHVVSSAAASGRPGGASAGTTSA